MQLIRPIDVTPAALTSNVAESEPSWLIGTTYAKGVQVQGTGAGVHKVYESQQAGNVGHNPVGDDGTWWLEAGATNRWRMFDASVSSQTSNASSIAVTIQTTSRVDSVALFNIDAASVLITMTDATDGVVYSSTISTVSSDGITDWYAYFFEPVVRQKDLVVMDLPPYLGASIAITLSTVSGTVKCGAAVLGLSKDIGGTQAGGSVGIIDYSRKEKDAFGTARFVERPFSKRATFTVWVPDGLVDQVQDILATYRAQPIVYVGSPKYGSTVIFGIYRDFSIEITYPTRSLCSLSLEGLT